MKSVLVLYGTTDGHTAKIAGVIADALRAEGCFVDVVEAKFAHFGTSPGAYDAVIMAASVHAGGYQRAFRRWVRAHAGSLGRRPTAFLSVCLGVLEVRPEARRDLERILDAFLAPLSFTPDQIKMVAGALPYTRYGWLKKRIMRSIARRASGGTDITRDYEYTDWDDLRTFARDFAGRHGLAEPRDRSPSWAGYSHEQSDY